jgi:hypothetical protein
MKRKFVTVETFNNSHLLSSLEKSSGLLHLIVFLTHLDVRKTSKCSRYLRKRLIPWLTTHTVYKFPKVCTDVKPLHMTFLEKSKGFGKFVPQLISAFVHFDANFKSKMWKQVQTLGLYVNQSKISLPPNLKRLSLGSKFNSPIDVLPDSLKFLQVGRMFQYPIVINSCLESLIIVSPRYNFPLGPLPPSLKYLQLSGGFNQALYDHTGKQQLPNNLEILKLPGYFDQTLGILPNSLLQLTIGDRFNQNLGILPLNLHTLNLGKNYSQTIDAFPNNLQTLVIGEKMIVTAIFPDSLKMLTINCLHKVPNLPPFLECLKIGRLYKHKLNVLPQSLTDLDVYNGKDIVNLPNNLKTLLVFYEMSDCKLPDSLIKLHLGGKPCQNLVLPPNLRFLYLGRFYRLLKVQHIDVARVILPKTLCILNAYGLNVPIGRLPENLTVLRLGNEFNYPLGVLPPKLRILSIGYEFNQPIQLPNSLTELKLGDNFNHPIILPTRLESLEIGYEFNQSLLTIPKSLKNLKLGTCFIAGLGTLPKNLKTLKLGRDFDTSGLLDAHKKMLK